MVKFHKVISKLPVKLEPGAIYAVRTGGGIDMYVANATGKTAHGLNGPFTPASHSEITATHVYFDLGDRINRFDRKTREKTTATGAWANRATLGYS